MISRCHWQLTIVIMLYIIALGSQWLWKCCLPLGVGVSYSHPCWQCCCHVLIYLCNYLRWLCIIPPDNFFICFHTLFTSVISHTYWSTTYTYQYTVLYMYSLLVSPSCYTWLKRTTAEQNDLTHNKGTVSYISFSVRGTTMYVHGTVQHYPQDKS